MYWELWLANHPPVNTACKCTTDRGVSVNSHCEYDRVCMHIIYCVLFNK